MLHEKVQLLKEQIIIGNIIIGKDKINEDVYLEGGGDWDFTLMTLP